MLHVYGLRTHELWWASHITQENKKENCQYGWAYVRGEHRSKSKHVHWVFLIYVTGLFELITGTGPMISPTLALIVVSYVFNVFKVEAAKAAISPTFSFLLLLVRSN